MGVDDCNVTSGHWTESLYLSCVGKDVFVWFSSFKGINSALSGAALSVSGGNKVWVKGVTVNDCETSQKTAGILTVSVNEGIIEETYLDTLVSATEGGVGTEIGLNSGGRGSHRGVTAVFCMKEYNGVEQRYSIFTRNGANGDDEGLNISFCKALLIHCFGGSMTGTGTCKFTSVFGSVEEENVFQVNVPKGDLSCLNAVNNTQKTDGYRVFGGRGTSVIVTQCIAIFNSVSYFAKSDFVAFGNILFGNSFPGNVSVTPSTLGSSQCPVFLSAKFSEVKAKPFGRVVGHVLISGTREN